jgi:hypothetical protein
MNHCGNGDGRPLEALAVLADPWVFHSPGLFRRPFFGPNLRYIYTYTYRTYGLHEIPTVPYRTVPYRTVPYRTVPYLQAGCTRYRTSINQSTLVKGTVTTVYI